MVLHITDIFSASAVVLFSFAQFAVTSIVASDFGVDV